MPELELGLCVDPRTVDRSGRTDDPVRRLLLTTTFVDPPRRAGARSVSARARAVHARAELGAYVWHFVSHSIEDGLRGLGGRAPAGTPARFGGLQDTREVKGAYEATLACAEGLGAGFLVLRTPPSLTPGASGRQTLRAFLERNTVPLPLCWEPHGLWEAGPAADLAATLGIGLLLPAFGAGPPTELPSNAWLRADTGSGRGVGTREIELLLRLHEAEHGPSVVFFTGPRAYAASRSFAELAG